MTDFSEALVAELAKKSGLVWVSYEGHAHPVWHEWIGGAVCVVVNGSEQPLPDIASQPVVTLLLRSKAHRHLVAEAEATVEVIPPESEHWDVVTTTLRSGRLNVADRDNAIERWAAESQVVRLVPSGKTIHTDSIPSTIGQSTPRLASR